MHDEDTPAAYSHPDPAIDAALDWLLWLREDPSAETRAAHDRWQAADPANRRAFAAVSASWNHAALRAASAPPAAVPDRPRSRAARWAVGLAAAVALGVGLLQAPDLWLRWSADHLTEAGEHATVHLPDGSRATLNTASAIAVDFVGDRREVRLLEGEVFFKVAHDARHPFVVSTRFGEVRVTGTAFDVRSDPAGDGVILREGKVQVRAGGQRVALEPGEGARIARTGIQADGSRDLAAGLAWLDGWIDVENRPLADAVAEIARYTPGPVLLLPGAGSAPPVSGRFRTADPEGGIRTLAALGGLSVRRLPGGGLLLY